MTITQVCAYATSKSQYNIGPIATRISAILMGRLKHVCEDLYQFSYKSNMKCVGLLHYRNSSSS